METQKNEKKTEAAKPATAPKTSETKTAKTEAPLVEAEDESKSLAIYDPKAEEGWQILDTGEGRLYWHRDAEADPKDKRANTIMGFASDVASFEQENRKTGEIETRHFVILQTSAPCWVVGEEKDERGRAIAYVAPKGTLVWIGVTHALQGLHAKVRSSPVVLEVQIKAVEQKDIGGGQTVWRLAQAVRATKRRRLVEVPQAAASPEEVPF